MNLAHDNGTKLQGLIFKENILEPSSKSKIFKVTFFKTNLRKLLGYGLIVVKNLILGVSKRLTDRHIVVAFQSKCAISNRSSEF